MVDASKNRLDKGFWLSVLAVLVIFLFGTGLIIWRTSLEKTKCPDSHEAICSPATGTNANTGTTIGHAPALSAPVGTVLTLKE